MALSRLIPALVVLSVIAAGCTDSHGLRDDAGDDGDGGTSGEVDAGRLFPQPGSWSVVATLRPTEGSFPDGSAEIEHAFTMVVVGSPGSGARIVAGAVGDETEFVASAPDEHQLVATETIEIAIASTAPCGGRGPAAYDGVSLRFDDLDGNHWDESMTGTATGSIRFVQGDVIGDAPFTATWVGERDTVGPAIEITGALTDRNPVDGVLARIGEPVANGLSVVLVDPEGGEIVLQRPDGRESSFATPHGTVLAFGTTYDVQVRAVFADHANNPGTGLPLSVATAADPGVQPEDGFDGGALALTSGSVVLVDSADGARVISGSSSLVLLPPSAVPGAGGGGRATLRLAVSPGDTTLRLRYALLAGESGEGFLFGSARVFADGSTPATLPLESASPPDGWTPTSIANAPLGGPVREVSIALPATAAARGEVVLDVQVGATVCAGPLPMLLGLMLDDVTID